MNIPDNILQHGSEIAQVLVAADELSPNAEDAAKDLAGLLLGDDPYMPLIIEVFMRVAERRHITYTHGDVPTLTHDFHDINQHISYREGLKRILRGDIPGGEYQSTTVRYEKNTLYATPNTHVRALFEEGGIHAKTGRKVNVRAVTYGAADHVLENAGQKIEAAQDPVRLVYDMFDLHSDWIDEYIVHDGDTILERTDTRKDAMATLQS